jgi:voltage-gated potassium channel
LDLDLRKRTYDSFDRMVELPMLVLALAMVPLLLAPELIHMSASLKETFFFLDWFIWAIFGLELTVKTYLSPDRPRYLRQHWFDVLIVVLPFLRPLRLVRSARLLRVGRGARLLSFSTRLVHSSRVLLKPEGLRYALLAGALLFFACAVLALLFEKDAGGNIDSLGDAVWWGAATISTVGYGDRFPVTVEGRAIAVFLMLLGISLFSLITASVAAIFVRPGQEREQVSLEDVLKRLDDLERLIESLRPGPSQVPELEEPTVSGAEPTRRIM